MTTIEGNKIIAEFMGWHYSKSGKTIRKSNNSSPYRIKDINYNSSWDWIMPVVEEIESLHYKIIIGGGDHWGNYCNIMFGKSEKEHRKLLLTDGAETKALGKSDSKIKSVWLAVVEFINWYNQTNERKNL